VAVSDDRKIDTDGRCKTLVVDTVDVKNATYSNSIGDPVLGAYWKDPESDPGQLGYGRRHVCIKRGCRSAIGSTISV
jgi:hypothetical protein